MTLKVDYSMSRIEIVPVSPMTTISLWFMSHEVIAYYVLTSDINFEKSGPQSLKRPLVDAVAMKFLVGAINRVVILSSCI